MTSILTLRPEAFEHGLLPIHQLFPRVDSVSAVEGVAKHLVTASTSRPTAALPDRRIVTVGTVANCLAVPEAHATILLDVLISLLPSYLKDESEEEMVVDVHLLLVFLILQSYNKPSQRRTGDIWPAGEGAAFSADLSPTKASVSISAARNRATSSGDDPSQLAYVQKHFGTLLTLLKDGDTSRPSISAGRFDRLGLILRRAGATADAPLAPAAGPLFASSNQAPLSGAAEWLGKHVGAAPAAVRHGA
eukprot:CAMPEP_0118954582 /NCGR_PEP_ID=MMETSP1169-20130426/58496_1 /TAXON_ID=36882 /ORGANISM="Pyramimonas obovata, Strain CCMP722" /LENGTH=247 /DNA_ID=CAMNT_0006902239 /DNA_START=49 /DNA_END=789 /DNA_ORIENTATION=+